MDWQKRISLVALQGHSVARLQGHSVRVMVKPHMVASGDVEMAICTMLGRVFMYCYCGGERMCVTHVANDNDLFMALVVSLGPICRVAQTGLYYMAALENT